MATNRSADRSVAVCVDAGTTVIKAVVFDAHGSELAVQRCSTAVHRPLPDRSEQDMDEVWEAVVRTIAAAVARVGRPVRLIAVTAQGDGVWLVDAAGRPVRPAILWNDGRATPLVDRWRVNGMLEQVHAITGSQQSAGMAAPLLHVLAEEEPESLRSAATATTCGGWLLHKLTGRVAVDPSEMSASWLDVREGRYSDELVGLYGLDRYRELLPPLPGADARAHPLSTVAAARLGVRAGIPVLLAPYDIVATAAGSGSTRPGQAVSVLGTTLCTEVVTAGADLTGPPHGLTLAVGPPGRYLRAFPTLAGCEVVDWLAALLGLPGAAAVSELAGLSAPGADGLRLLPYLAPSGERAPFLDVAATGVLTGVTFGHGRPQLARAVLEGLAYVIRHCLDATPVEPAELRLCGGGSAGALWCQIIADVCGIDTVRTTDEQTGAKGALITALTALGEYPGPDEAVAALVVERDRFVPDKARHDHYAEEYTEFHATRDLAAHRWDRWTRPGARRSGD